MNEQAKYYTTADPPACSCPDAKYRGRERLCKHVLELRAAYAIIKANAAKWEEREHEHPARDRS